jgi:hypothetical protein
MTARDETDAVSVPADAVVRRHAKIRESTSHWGWWLFGGVAMIGGTGGAVWAATHNNNNNNSNSAGRSLVVSW